METLKKSRYRKWNESLHNWPQLSSSSSQTTSTGYETQRVHFQFTRSPIIYFPVIENWTGDVRRRNEIPPNRFAQSDNLEARVNVFLWLFNQGFILFTTPQLKCSICVIWVSALTGRSSRLGYCGAASTCSSETRRRVKELLSYRTPSIRTPLEDDSEFQTWMWTVCLFPTGKKCTGSRMLGKEERRLVNAPFHSWARAIRTSGANDDIDWEFKLFW